MSCCASWSCGSTSAAWRASPRRAPAMAERLKVLAALLALSACTVGPEHRVPETPLDGRFDQATDEATARPVASELWSGFGSAELDALIVRALAANTTIAQANARLAENRAISGLSVYYWFPTVTAAAD